LFKELRGEFRFYWIGPEFDEVVARVEILSGEYKDFSFIGLTQQFIVVLGAWVEEQT
jgi:hypothetical protein